MRHAAALLAAGVLIGAGPGYVPQKGVVPDAATAMRVAEAVLVPVYGAGTISSEKPLSALHAAFRSRSYATAGFSI